MVEKDTKNKEKVEGFINRKEMRKFFMENDVHSLDDVEDIISEMEKVILEEILQGEMDSHLGYSKYDYENKDTDNSRNGYSSKDKEANIYYKSDREPKQSDKESNEE